MIFAIIIAADRCTVRSLLPLILFRRPAIFCTTIRRLDRSLDGQLEKIARAQFGQHTRASRSDRLTSLPKKDPILHLHWRSGALKILTPCCLSLSLGLGIQRPISLTSFPCRLQEKQKARTPFLPNCQHYDCSYLAPVLFVLLELQRCRALKAFLWDRAKGKEGSERQRWLD